MRFADVVGQDGLKDMLRKGVDQGRISHAQLFTGECGYGTLPLVLAYAQYINCSNRKDGDSCGECPSCLKMEMLVHPDLHFVFPSNSPMSGGQRPSCDIFLPQWRETVKSTEGYFAEQQWYDAIEIGNKQGMISRSDADQIVRKLSYKSFEGEYKIVVMWMAEKMNPQAANALLKILEEPWDKTLFLLISEEPQLLLTTILSRTQQIAVAGIEQQKLAKYIAQKDGLAIEEAQRVARLSGGDLIGAESYVSSGSASRDGENFDLFTSLMRLSYNDRHMELLEWADGVAAFGREQKRRFFEYAIGMLRESYVMNCGVEQINYLYGEELDFCRKFSPFIANHNIEQLVAELERASAQIVQNGNPKIILAHMVLVISKLIRRL